MIFILNKIGGNFTSNSFTAAVFLRRISYFKNGHFDSYYI